MQAGDLSEIPIGNVSTLSGILGELFAPARSALQTFVASQNACGGLNGHRIKLFIDDDQSDPATAASKVTQMIQKHKVLAFVGNIQVLTMEAVAPVIKKYGIPIIGTDSSNNTWFTTPLVFPQGSPVQSISYGYLDATKNYFNKKNLGNISCIEVPRPCEALDRSIREMAPALGIEYKKNIPVSITAPSYVQQCLEMKNAGVEALILDIDAASMVRVARSCRQVGYQPKLLAYPLAVGNEKQFLAGDKWLGDTYVPMNVFPWQGNTTPAEKYWQDSIKKFNPGFDLGWRRQPRLGRRCTAGRRLRAAVGGEPDHAAVPGRAVDLPGPEVHRARWADRSAHLRQGPEPEGPVLPVQRHRQRHQHRVEERPQQGRVHQDGRAQRPAGQGLTNPLCGRVLRAGSGRCVGADRSSDVRRKGGGVAAWKAS